MFMYGWNLSSVFLLEWEMQRSAPQTPYGSKKNPWNSLWMDLLDGFETHVQQCWDTI